MSKVVLPEAEFNAIGDAVDGYRKQLNRFIDYYDIPTSMVSEADHLVFKAADPVDFEGKVKAIRPLTETERVAFTEVDGRFLAAAKVVVPWALGASHVDWLEVMEPKEAAGYDYIGLEYCEFYFPDINSAEDLLKSRQLKVERLVDRRLNWRWLNVKINDDGQEFRLSDTKLVEIVECELEEGSAKLI